MLDLRGSLFCPLFLRRFTLEGFHSLGLWAVCRHILRFATLTGVLRVRRLFKRLALLLISHFDVITTFVVSVEVAVDQVVVQELIFQLKNGLFRVIVVDLLTWQGCEYF
jgi:hypothetical protein